MTQGAAQRVVSIIGVGNMGGGMATNLLARGYRVLVHDIDAAKVAFYQSKGALAPVDSAQAATKSIVTIICVVDAEQTQDVLFGASGLVPSLPKGHTVVLCSTIAPQDVERYAARLAECGIHCIDAPMSGGPARAADGSMSLMVACADAVFTQHAQLINDLSSKVFRISQRLGDGARTKLVNNLLAGINLVGAAEALALAQRLGLDLATTLAVIEQSSGQSWIGSDRMHRALAGDYAPRARMGMLAKDTGLALAAAQSAGVTPSLGQVAHASFIKAMQAGLESHDDAALFTLLQRQFTQQHRGPLS